MVHVLRLPLDNRRMTNYDTQILQMLKERRGGLSYDLRRHAEKGDLMAKELSETERAIADLERKQTKGSD